MLLVYTVFTSMNCQLLVTLNWKARNGINRLAPHKLNGKTLRTGTWCALFHLHLIGQNSSSPAQGKKGTRYTSSSVVLIKVVMLAYVHPNKQLCCILTSCFPAGSCMPHLSYLTANLSIFIYMYSYLKYDDISQVSNLTEEKFCQSLQFYSPCYLNMGWAVC